MTRAAAGHRQHPIDTAFAVTSLVPGRHDEVELEIELEIGDDGASLEAELNW